MRGEDEGGRVARGHAPTDQLRGKHICVGVLSVHGALPPQPVVGVEPEVGRATVRARLRVGMG